MYTDFLTLILANYFCLNNFLCKSAQINPSFLLFDIIADKVHSFHTLTCKKENLNYFVNIIYNGAFVK